MEILAEPVRSTKKRELWSFGVAASLAGFYFITSLYIASRRPLWFDEILTVMYARIPGAATIWRAVFHTDPWEPATPYLAFHFAGATFGTGQLGIRVISAITLSVGLLITFDCARRSTDGLHGLIAIAFLTCSGLPFYGYEARCYGMYFMCAAAAFWIWTHARNSRREAVAFGFAVFLACCLHPYAALCLLPFGLADLAQQDANRRWPVSYKFLAGFLGASVGIGTLTIQLPAVLLAPTGFSVPRPAFGSLQNTYSELFPSGVLLLVLCAIWTALFSKTSPGNLSVLRPMATPAERAGWLFFLFPLAGLALTNPVTHASPPRYFLGMLPGVAVALACLIWRATNAVIHMRKVNLVAMGILTLFATVGIARQIKTMRAPELIDPYGQLGQTREFLKLEENLVWQDGREFIVWNGPGLYLTAKQYSKFSERYIFLRPDDEHERAQVWNRILDWAEYAPVKIWPMKDLAAQIGRAAVVEPMPSTVAAMQKMGFEVSIRYTRPVRIVYFIPSTKRQLLRSAT